ncbi:MAG: helix-turn-helix domain-containing protein [Rickettsiales bacterium]|jgi:probable addiction module antidote protein|nr:helix-turn-helix domain-containing protein [Rickettsiales bacterium]
MTGEIITDIHESRKVSTAKRIPKFASVFLENEILKCKKSSDVANLKAQLKIVARNYGWTKLEKKAGLSRTTLYNTLNGKKEPRFSNFLNILDILGFDFSVKRREE